MNTKQMLSLTIHHNIRLTRDQRYDLHNGKSVEVVGVSVPVWFMGKATSEPAKEIFCKYHLKNNQKMHPVKILADGYEITLPNRAGSEPKRISDKEWRDMDQSQRDDYYSLFVSEISSKSLLDIEDGGSKRLNYREQNKVKQNDDFLRSMHYIDIGEISESER